MKPTSKPEIAATASSAVANTTSSSTTTPVGDCETVSRRYQAEVLGITIFGVVGFVVFIKYVVTKFFAELEAIQRQQSKF